MDFKIILLIIIIALSCLIVCVEITADNQSSDVDNSIQISNNSNISLNYTEIDTDMKRLWY
ncbi:MAG: hypothetical protein MJ209_06925 [archaeon]|nr:hypothetical protein [archaeon]